MTHQHSHKQGHSESCCQETCCCCHSGECSHHEHYDHHHDDFAHQLIEMADEAWMELLKEKIKEQIKSSSGAQLEQLAKIVAEGNHTRWKHKMGLQKDLQNYQGKLNDFFHRD